jgi:protein-S-isoprenylcysteine O-methyltransferase Ste14
MIAQITLATMLFSMLAFGGLYIYSVFPAHLERRMGADAFRRCGRFRKASFTFLFLFAICEVVTIFLPMDFPLPHRLFPGWYWLLSAAIGVLLMLPATMILRAAQRAAKSESFAPSQRSTMYGGIYQRIRHPQMVGDLLYWFALAFLLNSPVLLLVNLLWIPINLVMAFAEELDLMLRFGEGYVAYRRSVPMLIPRNIATTDDQQRPPYTPEHESR